MKKYNRSLVKKISLYFVIIMLAAFFLIYLGVSGIMIKNNEKTIGRDMANLQTNARSFITQSLELRSMQIQQNGVTDTLPKIIEEMNLVLGVKSGIYSKNGTVIYTTVDPFDNIDDIEYASKGYYSYTIDYSKNSTHVYYSFMMNIKNSMCIIRLESDYTKLYDNSEYITTLVLIGSAAILAAAFIVLIVMIFDVISPIKRLSEAIRSTAERPEKAVPIAPVYVRRRDEIGMLANDYNYMAYMIKTQMDTIEREKNNLNKTLEYRKTFFDNITHELKTPLTIIIGYAEMMEQTDFKDREFNQKGINNIIKESKRLKDMVTGLLDSSRETSIPENKREIFNIAPVISDVCESMNIKAQRYNDSVICDCESAQICGSRDMIRRLLINLIDNAIKYGKSGEKISVGGTLVSDNYKLSISNKLSKMHPVKDVSKLFVPFYRSREEEAKREKGSVGLGLAICKSIAIAHHGNITAIINDEIITFLVTLPAETKGGVHE